MAKVQHLHAQSPIHKGIATFLEEHFQRTEAVSKAKGCLKVFNECASPQRKSHKRQDIAVLQP